MACSDLLDSCMVGWAEANASLARALAEDAADPCVPSADSKRDLPLRVAAVFIVFASSFAGVLTTTAAQLAPRSALRFAPGPFAIALGKTVGTGVVIACALVHMLQPAAESLTSACLPASFQATDYGAYAYLFAMYAALAMHLIEYAIARLGGEHATGLSHGTAEASSPQRRAYGVVAGEESALLAPLARRACAADGQRSDCANAHCAVIVAEVASSDRAAPPGQHSTVAALSMEFGLSVHSLFIGLAMAVAGDANFRVLLAALTFHQFFEGVGLGARLAEASMTQRLRAALALIFSVAAPVGIATGVALMDSPSYNPNGGDFLLSQGSLDGVCAGILLYLGFQMLADLGRDLERFCDSPGATHAAARRTALFVALWGGAGSMAAIGKFL